MQGVNVQSPDDHVHQAQTPSPTHRVILDPQDEGSTSPRDMELTLRRIKHLHGVDEVGTGIEVVGPWLLQPAQAEDNPINHGTGSEGAAAGHAGVAYPAPCLQVKDLEGGDGQLALSTPCAQRRCCGCQCLELALLVCSASRMRPAGCSAGQHGATLGCTRSFSGL